VGQASRPVVAAPLSARPQYPRLPASPRPRSTPFDLSPARLRPAPPAILVPIKGGSNRMRMNLCRLALAAVLGSGLVPAQSVATWTGTVVDPTEAVVPEAEVTCRHTGTGLTYTTRTNAEGLFRFPDLPIGPYEVTATHAGFDRLVRGGLQLLTGRTVDLR